MACNHTWQTWNDVNVCVKCGLMRFPDGSVMFDRDYPNEMKRHKKRVKKRGKGKRSDLS